MPIVYVFKILKIFTKHMRSANDIILKSLLHMQLIEIWL